MMRGLQIWPQNSNRIPFDPPFGKKNCQNWQDTRFSQFSTVFGQKGGQMLFDLNFEARFGILSSFSICLDPI